MENQLQIACDKLKKSKYTLVFTGAGISVESGIPPFRGEHGLWNKYNPEVLDLGYYMENQEKCWKYIREIFYDFFSDACFNGAHKVLAEWEKNELVQAIVTQNIDNLHQEAGSQNVIEFHGNSKKLTCLECGKKYKAKDIDFENIPPRCTEDNSVLKPDFIFFGEGIPTDAYSEAFAAAEQAEVCLIIGSTGEVMPASQVPRIAKQSGATVIEVNPDKSMFTKHITDIHLTGPATEILSKMNNMII